MSALKHHFWVRLGHSWRLWPLATVLGVMLWAGLSWRAPIGNALAIPMLHMVIAVTAAHMAQSQGQLFAFQPPMPALPMSLRGRTMMELGAGWATLGTMLALLGLPALLMDHHDAAITAAWILLGAGALLPLLHNPRLTQRAPWFVTVAAMAAGAWGLYGAMSVVPSPHTTLWAPLLLGAMTTAASILGTAAPLAGPSRRVWGTWRQPLHESSPGPEARMRATLWRSLARDSAPGAALGLAFGLFFMGVQWWKGDPPPLHLMLADVGIITLCLMASITPSNRSQTPLRAARNQARHNAQDGFLDAYRVLPLPKWWVLRRIYLHSAGVFGLFGGLAVGLTLLFGVDDAGHVRPVVWIIGCMLLFGPLGWSLTVATADGIHRRHAALFGAALAAPVSLLLGLSAWADDRHTLAAALMAVGALSLMAALVWPLRALWPPPRVA